MPNWVPRPQAAKRLEHVRALAALPDAVRGALALDGEMRALAGQLKDARDLIFFGRGYNFSTALEAALKASATPRARAAGRCCS
jgi:glucosamine--fructose-6-phosphate aminotransferase (isomerizing)